MKIAIVSNTGWSLFNFRQNLMISLEEAGHEVVAISPEDEYTSLLPIQHQHINMSRKGKNPFNELSLMKELRKKYIENKLDCVLHFTTKPNIWGTLAASSASRIMGRKIRVINNIAGLGIVFSKKGPVRWILENLYRFTQRKAGHIFFQNPDDLEMFEKAKLVPSEKISQLPGSGVDLSKFPFSPLKNHDSTKLIFIMSARLLKEKGVCQFVEAAKKIKKEYPNTVFQLLGKVDPGNHTSVSQEEIDQWVSEGVIQWIPWSDNVSKLITKSDCVVLPSFYREGTPRSLLEGMAVGRPIITTDSPGCRETVVEGVNGFMVQPRSTESLIEAIKKLISLSWESRTALSEGSRDLAQNKFDEKIVIKRYIEIIKATEEC